ASLIYRVAFGSFVLNRGLQSPPNLDVQLFSPELKAECQHIAAWLLRYRVKHQSSTDNSEFRHRTLRI
ncbi:hypothetical protein J6590_105986, partial [Homalodisca vitripennis]